MITDDIRKLLFQYQDLDYRKFYSKLIPNVDINNIIGVRIPVIKKLAKSLMKEPDIEYFLNDLPHKYYDENNLHGLIISEFKDYYQTVHYINLLLPYVNNWSTCDLLRPKAFKTNRNQLKNDIEYWLKSGKVYAVRFGIEMIMTHFLDEDFDIQYLDRVAAVNSDEYYIKMMIAWFFATALSKQWGTASAILTSYKLDPWTHNKTIQKAIESYRITGEQKEFLKSLKV